MSGRLAAGWAGPPEEAVRGGCSVASLSCRNNRVAFTAAVSRTNRGCALYRSPADYNCATDCSDPAFDLQNSAKRTATVSLDFTSSANQHLSHVAAH